METPSFLLPESYSVFSTHLRVDLSNGPGSFFIDKKSLPHHSAESSIFKSVLHFFIGLFVHLMTNFLSSLYILEISPLSDMGLVKIFSLFLGCHFVLLTISFALQKLLSFRRPHLLIVSLSVCATGVIFRKWSPVPMSSSVLPTFSSMRFS